MFYDDELCSASRRTRQRSRWDRASLYGAVDWKNTDFRCMVCRAYVTAQFMFARVQHRNHCPYCLWSRHMDLHHPGDRLSACKGSMQPVALTLKKQYKKYAVSGQGELMLVHQCSECDGIAINRVAADDDPGLMLEVFERSLILAPSTIQRIESQGIEPLMAEERRILLARLFGTIDNLAIIQG